MDADKRFGNKCVVQLGRYGDIISILPALWGMAAEEQKRPHLLVGKQFSTLLDGVSYVVPDIWEGEITRTKQARRSVESHYDETIVSQVYSKDMKMSMSMESFVKDMWLNMGYLSKWGKLPLVFDRRNKKREKLLASTFLHREQPNILICTKGHSSPFQEIQRLADLIHSKWCRRFHIVYLDSINAEYIYDMLGLMDRAKLLITIDTSLYHLSQASKVPTILLRTHHPTLWHGSPIYKNVVLDMRYNEFIHRMDCFHDAIEEVYDKRESEVMVHVYSQYPEKDANNARRKHIAAQTWAVQYQNGWVKRPVPDTELKRDDLFRDGDVRTLPKIKAIIDKACEDRALGDVIVFTNSDVCLAPDADEILQNYFRTGKACYAFRIDFGKIRRPLTVEEVEQGKKYAGSDLHAFTVGWWKRYRNQFPDMVIGAEGWDLCMRVLMDGDSGEKEVHNVIYHEWHNSVWEQGENRNSLPSQVHNLDLARQFCNTQGFHNDSIF